MNRLYSPLMAVLWNLMLVYLVYQVARIAYYLENAQYFTFTSDVFWGGLVFDTSAILYTNALYVLLMLFPLHLKETIVWHRLCKWLFLVVNALTLAMNLADSVYFQYTMRRTTTTVFSEFSHDSNVGGIILGEFLRHWYFVLLFAVVVFLLWKLYATPRLYERKQLSWWRYDLSCLFSLLLYIPFCVAGMRGGFATAIRPITISNANQYTKRPIDAALVLNTPFALIRTYDTSVFIVPNYYDDEQQMAAVYTPVRQPADSIPMVRKNVVVLIVESFGREYIGALNTDLEGGRYKGYTPYVDALIRKSTTFRYSYCNGRKSIDGMPSILSSIPMFVEPFILTPSSMNDYTGLAGILAAEGWQTAFFHGAQNGSMGFQAFANKTGFQQYFGRTEYEEERGTNDFDGTWAIWDEPFLQYYASKMSEMKEPFMTAVFTASSHHPYAVPDKYKKVYPEEGIEIHKCIRYTDMAIGRFFETASRQPWFNNTIFVLTSDHTNITDHDYYATDLGGYCVPIIIYEPGTTDLHPSVVDKIAQQIDILPTVLGLLHYQKPYLAFGIDVLNTAADDTWAVNYLNGVYQYVKKGYVLQHDGAQTKAVYALSDSLMRHDMAGSVPEQPQMERELKAIIQQYMSRMVSDRLTP